MSASAHLTYCLNIHPAESWAETLAAIRTWPAAVRQQAGWSGPFGLGLRLSARAAVELEEAGQAAWLRDSLADQDFYAFTINGFPFGAFHGGPVKERVYEPDWSTLARADYTVRLAGLLAELLPPGVAGSISTVPVGRRAALNDPRARLDAVRQLCRVVAALQTLERIRGRHIALALEPEPGCLLETAADCVRFWKDTLRPAGLRILQDDYGLSAPAAVQGLDRHLGVCFDTCHIGVMYGDLVGSLRELTAAGIAIPKIQLSAAPCLLPSAPRPGFLAALRTSPYLHQVVARYGKTFRMFTDLADAEANAEAAGADEWRVHCHVPLYLECAGDQPTTRRLMDDAFFAAAAAAGVEHYECETYTFAVLPGELKVPDLAASIARELEWAKPRVRAPRPS